jgi:putative DNA primase/helicase
MIDAQTIAEALEGKRSGKGFLACCPAHDDKNPSLSIDDGDNGKPVVFCNAGCSQEAVIAALTERGLWPDTGNPLSPKELEAIKAESAKRRKDRESMERLGQQQATARALEILRGAVGDPTGHRYSLTKKVPFGPLVKRGPWRQRGWNDALLVPLFDESGQIVSVQAINENLDDKKDLLYGGRKKGCFHPLGKLRGATGRVLIGEGLATVAAAVSATGLPGVMAIDAGNLLPVAEVVRRLAPSAEIIVLADDDQEEEATNA